MAEYIKKQELLNDTKVYKDDSGVVRARKLHFRNYIKSLPTADVIRIPEGATNGDMIKALFPSVEIIDKGFHNITVIFGDYRNQMYRNHYDEEWWNAPYKKEVE